MSGDRMEFGEIRPHLLLLLELYRNAGTDEARANLVGLFENAFLTTAWHVAKDLLDNGWEPVAAGVGRRGAEGRLRLVR